MKRAKKLLSRSAWTLAYVRVRHPIYRIAQKMDMDWPRQISLSFPSDDTRLKIHQEGKLKLQVRSGMLCWVYGRRLTVLSRGCHLSSICGADRRNNNCVAISITVQRCRSRQKAVIFEPFSQDVYSNNQHATAPTRHPSFEPIVFSRKSPIDKGKQPPDPPNARRACPRHHRPRRTSKIVIRRVSYSLHLLRLSNH